MQEKTSIEINKLDKLSKKDIGSRFRELRQEKGISQQSMAGILNVSRSNYSQIELGNQFPTFETLAIISDYCSCSYEWLLHGEANQSTPDITDPRLRTEIDIPFPKTPVADRRTLLVMAMQLEGYIQRSTDPGYLLSLPALEIPSSVLDDHHSVFRVFAAPQDNLSLGIIKSDLIVARQLSNLSEVLLSHTFVILTATDLLVCTISDLLIGSQVLICNDNGPRPQQFPVKISQIREVWMATGVYSTRIGPAASKIGDQLAKFQTVLKTLQDEITELGKVLKG